MTFKGFLSYHDFYCHIKFNVYHKQFFFNDGTQAPDLANYVFTTRAIKQIKIKINKENDDRGLPEGDVISLNDESSRRKRFFNL